MKGTSRVKSLNEDPPRLSLQNILASQFILNGDESHGGYLKVYRLAGRSESPGGAGGGGGSRSVAGCGGYAISLPVRVICDI